LPVVWRAALRSLNLSAGKPVKEGSLHTETIDLTGAEHVKARNFEVQN